MAVQINVNTVKSKASETRSTPYSDEELEYFRKLILDKKAQAEQEIEKLCDQLNSRESLDTDSAYSFHLGDAASESLERERLYLMIEHQRRLIGYLDRALERVKNKTYGICRVTGKPIAKERLEAIPHTDISVEAKIRQQGLLH